MTTNHLQKRITRHNRRRSSGGYTLVEMLMYVGIVVLVLVLVVSSLLAISRVYSQYRALNEVNQSSTVALDRLVFDLRHAQNIDELASEFATTSGHLVITDQNGDTVEYYRDGAKMMRSTASNAISLLDEDVSVEALEFRHITVTEGEGVRVRLRVTSETSSTFIDRTFYTTASLR